MERTELLKQAEAAVLAAGELLRQGGALEIEKKGVTDFVTQIDRAVQARLERELFELDPGVQFMGEEKDNSGLDFAGRLWILDPVDGTTNLIHGLHHSVISLALTENEQAVGAIVYQPESGELFTAEIGGGAFLNGEPISVSQTCNFRESLISVGTNPGCREDADAMFARQRRIYDRCCDIRRIGAAALELCYVAAGRLDGYVEHGLKPWDYAAADLIIREAGGVVTDFSGNAPRCGSPSNIVAANPAIHRELLGLI